ncbi:hypothetical protein MUU47_08890 [Scandinavium sp. H11S7]|uniref:Uncharacterized protein n=1 Tax=Scandinavium hiltneri TaxID=2926519 RepID=A0ABT2E054_9ENTR|nr:hypothetical protein [Scandinavium hiltneri]MCS2161236.1 hypothetical protein [Scandinavium hiltneri]
MIDSDLLSSLSLLIDCLNKNNKKQSANFFIARLKDIADSESDLIHIKSTLKELSTCRAMSQYTGFTLAEEALLNDVVDNVLRVMKNNP